MLTAELLVEAIYRAQAAGVAEHEIGLTLVNNSGVATYTLRELREHLALALCREV